MRIDNKKLISTGRQVAQLRKGKPIIYVNPVAKERADIMLRFFHYAPIVSDAYTLKPNTYINGQS